MKKSLLIIIVSCFFSLEKVQAFHFSSAEFNVWIKSFSGFENGHRTLAFNIAYPSNLYKDFGVFGVFFETSFPQYINLNKIDYDQLEEYLKPLSIYKIGIRKFQSFGYVRLGYTRLTFEEKFMQIKMEEPYIQTIIRKNTNNGIFFDVGLNFDFKYFHININFGSEFFKKTRIMYYQISILSIKIINK